MSDQTKLVYPRVETLGPADPNAPAMQKLYTVLTAVGGLVGVASTFGMISGEQAASLGQVSTTGMAFVLALGTAAASFRTKKQVKNGTFTEVKVEPVAVPELPAVPALEQLKILRDVADQELNRGVKAANDAADVIGGVLGTIPVVGKPLAAAVNTADDALDMLGAFKQ